MFFISHPKSELKQNLKFSKSLEKYQFSQDKDVLPVFAWVELSLSVLWCPLIGQRYAISKVRLIRVRLTGYSTLPIGVNDCLFFCVSPPQNWRPV